jgi:hypothetical protein
MGMTFIIPKTDNKSIPVRVRIPVDMHTELKIRSIKTGVSMENMILELIKTDLAAYVADKKEA